MQALWRTLRNPSDEIAHVAFRVLGKFGGSNRKMLKEAQRLDYDDSNSSGPTVQVRFNECGAPIELQVSCCCCCCCIEEVLEFSRKDSMFCSVCCTGASCCQQFEKALERWSVSRGNWRTRSFRATAAPRFEHKKVVAKGATF